MTTSRYLSALTNGSPQYCRGSNCSSPDYYYQAFRLLVSTAGSYSFQSISTFNTYGYIYNNSFNASDPSANIVVYNDDDAGSSQFLLNISVDTLTKYILVVTTYSRNVTGPFSIIATAIPNIPANAGWAANGETIAGGHGPGNGSHQLDSPDGLFVDDDQMIVITDVGNHRIVQWNMGDTNGQIVAGGHGPGNRMYQLNEPTDVLIDKETDSFIICDSLNERVVRWSRGKGTSQGEILIDNIRCWGLAMDDQRYLYVSDTTNNAVKRYQIGDKNGILIAGGNGKGDGFTQFSNPKYLFVDRQQAIYVSDSYNNRVVKWNKGTTEGFVVAGDKGRGDASTQLYYPYGLFVDTSGAIYVGDSGNDRVMCWSQDAKQGTIIVGGNGRGAGANQFYGLGALSYDRQGNLYAVDWKNHRVQRFKIK
ncbi:unnamed protein product [Rotaria sp. Silwood1]|nr:unnamed protein product [Rotaria sp. Silwood1]CAF1650346.1 unnamed protein product [Rotaria sp. Silwood1]